MFNIIINIIKFEINIITIEKKKSIIIVIVVVVIINLGVVSHSRPK